MNLDIVRAAVLGDVPHGFFGRAGGVSVGPIAGLNCGLGSGDDPAAVEANRRKAADAVIPDAPLASVHQVHSPTAVIVREAVPHDQRPHADALVTDRPGLLLGIVTADCAPVLFADHAGVVVGAAHAGWRGALAGVTDATIEAMEQLGSKRGDIHAAIGPCIGQPDYEVDDAFRQGFIDADPDNARFFVQEPGGKPHFDLEAYVMHRLLAAGIGEVEALNLDTYGDADRFYSYRRSTHRHEPDYGRQLSAIALPG